MLGAGVKGGRVWRQFPFLGDQFIDGLPLSPDSPSVQPDWVLQFTADPAKFGGFPPGLYFVAAARLPSSRWANDDDGRLWSPSL